MTLLHRICSKRLTFHLLQHTFISIIIKIDKYCSLGKAKTIMDLSLNFIPPTKKFYLLFPSAPCAHIFKIERELKEKKNSENWIWSSEMFLTSCNILPHIFKTNFWLFREVLDSLQVAIQYGRIEIFFLKWLLLNLRNQIVEIILLSSFFIQFFWGKIFIANFYVSGI